MNGKIGLVLLTTLAAVTAGLLVGLGGCGGDDDPAQPADTTADLGLVTAVDDTVTAAGQPLVVSITLANLGPDGASGVKITTTLPQGLTRTSHLVNSGTYDTGTGVWSPGGLAADGTAVLRLFCTVAEGTGGQVLTCSAAVQSLDQDDPEPGNDQAAVEVTVAGLDLAVTKEVVDPALNAGETATFLIHVRNFSIAAATEVAVLDQLPAGLAYEASLASQGTFTPETGIWSVGALTKDQEATLTLLARVQAGTEGQTITNTAALESAQPGDGTPGNDSASAQVQVAAPQADLQLTMVADDPHPNVGQRVTVTVVLTNTGPNAAGGVQVTAKLPAGLSYRSAAADSGTFASASGVWTLDDLAFAATATLALTAVVDPGTGGDVLVPEAEITAAGQLDPDPQDDTAAVSITVQAADLAVQKTVDEPLPAELDEILYTLTVRNDGPDPASGVLVQDVLPFGVTLLDAVPAGVYAAQSGIWTIGDLAVGAQVNLELQARVNQGTAGGSIVNTAAVTGAEQEDPDPQDDSGWAGITVQGLVLPVANADDFLGQEGGTLQVTAEGGVLANDLSPAGHPLSAVLVSQPGHGSVALAADGSFTYVHDGGQSTTDGFTYRARDQQTLVLSNLGTVTIAVAPVNDAPTPADDAYAADEGGTLDVTSAAGVLVNDTDPEGDPLTAAVEVGPDHGVLLLQPDGSFTYVHDGSETAGDVFTYTVQDTAGATSQAAAVVITIAEVNDPPVALPDTLIVAEGGLQSDNARDNDTDPDDLFGTLTAHLDTQPVHGTLLAFFDDGYFTYRHDGGETTIDAFTYHLEDPQGAVSEPAAVTIVVTPVNDPPTGADFTVETAAGGTLVIDVIGHAADPDHPAEDLTITITGEPTEAASFTETAPGVWQYVHDGVGTGPDTITYTVTDGSEAVSAQYAITVTIL